MKIFNEVGEYARITSSLLGPGNALIVQNAFQVAKTYFVETINMATEEHLSPTLFDALIGIGSIRVQEIYIESAEEITD